MKITQGSRIPEGIKMVKSSTKASLQQSIIDLQILKRRRKIHYLSSKSLQNISTGLIFRDNGTS